jgi:hypothetical protein
MSRMPWRRLLQNGVVACAGGRACPYDRAETAGEPFGLAPRTFQSVASELRVVFADFFGVAALIDNDSTVIRQRLVLPVIRPLRLKEIHNGLHSAM